MFRKKSPKGEVQTEYSCSIRFLDDSEPIQLNFKKDTLGQWLFDRVCEKLSLIEKDYFGLRYVDPEKQRHWLDPLKTVYKQLKGVNPMVLCFRVKFYPEDPMKLHEEITRYYLYLQLRRDLHHGRLLCSPQDAVLLASYIVQSEVGDYDPQDHPGDYISGFKMLPKQNAKMEEQIRELHKTHEGQVPAEAESNFLKKASVLDTYGVDPHQVKDQRGDQLYLGVTHQGIMTFRGSRRTQLHKWNQIRRIAYEGKMFIVHVNVAEEEDAANAKKRKKEKKQQPHGYKCQTVGACKYLWRCAVEQQLFFTLASSINAPKLKSGGTLFNRGSKFRFSGRCQAEAFSASESIKRSEPKFARTNSLPNFARNKHAADSKSSTLNTSVMSEPVPEDRRRYNGFPEDTPNQSFEIPHKGLVNDTPVQTFELPNKGLIKETPAQTFELRNKGLVKERPVQTFEPRNKGLIKETPVQTFAPGNKGLIKDTPVQTFEPGNKGLIKEKPVQTFEPGNKGLIRETPVQTFEARNKGLIRETPVQNFEARNKGLVKETPVQTFELPNRGLTLETPNLSLELPHTEAAVDVPGNSFGAVTAKKLVESPVLKAPLASEERLEAQAARTVAASSPGQKTPVNGSIPGDSVLETSIDSMPGYHPNQTMDDEDDENTPKPSLDEQIKQLEEQYEKITSDQNHIAPGGKVPSATQPAAKPASKSPAKSKCATCCKVLSYSLLFAMVVMAGTFAVLFYTDYQHPLLDEGRKQLHFMEPVKHFIDDTVDTVVKKFK